MKRLLQSGLLLLSAFTVVPAISGPHHTAKQAPPSHRVPFQFGGLRSFHLVPLETVSETSSNASIGDVNGDGYPDIVLAKGRHWEVISRVFFGDGRGNFDPGPPLPGKATKSYSASLADMTKSGHPGHRSQQR